MKNTHCTLSFPSRAARTLGWVPIAALVLSAPASSQTFHVQAGADLQGKSSTSDWPQQASYVGTNQSLYQVATAGSGPGIAGGFSICEYHSNIGTYAVAKSNADFEFDDLVFTSTGTSTTEWVTLNLTLEGDFNVNNIGSTVEVKVQLQSTFVGTATAKQTGITATGVLSGYTMNTPLSFQVPFHVQVNTPFKMKVGLSQTSTTVYVGNKARSDYRLRLGGAPTGDSGSLHEVFTLPAGVTTVNSAQAGIVDNVWQIPDELYLMPSESVLEAGEQLVLTAWNGPPTQPVGLFLTAIDGVPVPVFLGASVLSVDGSWDLGPILHDPGLAGLSFGFTSFAIDLQGALLISREETVAVQ